MKTVLDLHREITRGLHDLFFSNDPVYLALALFGEAGELANFIKKEWRDQTSHKEAIRDEIVDLRVYVELLADAYGISGTVLDQAFRSEYVFVRKITVAHATLALCLARACGRLSGNVCDRILTDAEDSQFGIRREITTIRAYIESFAWLYGIDGDLLTQRVEDKLRRYAAKHSPPGVFGLGDPPRLYDPDIPVSGTIFQDTEVKPLLTGE